MSELFQRIIRALAMPPNGEYMTVPDMSDDALLYRWLERNGYMSYADDVVVWRGYAAYRITDKGRTALKSYQQVR